MTDKLIERVITLSNPTVVGLDTSFDYLPEQMRQNCKTTLDAAKSITEFNYKIIDKIVGIVPCVKVQIAYYEMYGVEGMQAFLDTVKYAKSKGLVVISDAKRNDIGSTAACYSSAFLGKSHINEYEFTPFDSDFLTINPYLGVDGIKPFMDDCKKYNKGVFILVKTSNPSSGQLQNRMLDDGKTLFETVGGLVEEWGADNIGKYGFSQAGAVVGATHPKEAKTLRELMPHTLFLVPGYGAQGGTADDLMPSFNDKGIGAVVNNSRGILCAYKADKYKDKIFDEAAYCACVDMQQDIYGALKRAGKAK